MPDYKKQFNHEPRVAVLQPGDILLKRNLDGFKSDPLGNIISFMQMITVSSGTNLPGAYVSGHAAIYLGADRIAEANGGGVVITPLASEEVKHVRYIVYRCSDQPTALRAAEIAETLNTRRRTARKWSLRKFGFKQVHVDGKYAGGRAALSLLNPRHKGRLGMGDQLLADVTEIYTDPQSTLATPNFFCSMFVYTVYEVASDDNRKFNYDPYSIDPKFYHKILESRPGLYTKQGKYIHAVSETVMGQECLRSVKEAIGNYESKKLNQRFKAFRKTSLESTNALEWFKFLARMCDQNPNDSEHYDKLITAGLYFTQSITEIPKIFPDAAQNWQNTVNELKEALGPPLATGSTLMEELDKTDFFKRLRSIRKSVDKRVLENIYRR